MRKALPLEQSGWQMEPSMRQLSGAETMTGAAHHRRGPNGTGYIRRVQRASGEVRYEARLRNEWLGSFESRAQAQAAIDERKKGIVVYDVLKASRGENPWSPYGGGDDAA